MLDQTTRRGQIIEAAMRLAAARGWSGLSLDEIASEAGCNLAEFRAAFQSKAQILAAFTRAVDDAVLTNIRPEPGTPARDRLFDVLMTRFEAMTPYKPALRRIMADLRSRPGDSLVQIGAAGRSIYWMMAAAGLDAEGPRGVVRIPGVMGIYARAFDTWLEDDDPGMARTMAALDSRLRRAERMVKRMDDIAAATSNVFASFRNRGRKRGPAEGMPSPAVTPTPEPEPAPHAPGNPPTGPAGTESGPTPVI